MNTVSDSKIPPFLQNKGLRLFLFSGKGGVGKTSCAVAAALELAGKAPDSLVRVVSTDPAHSLKHSLAHSQLPGNMSVVELDAHRCLERFKEKYNHHLRCIAQRGTFLDDEDINCFLDLSLPGLDELMAFLEISRWVKESRYDRIVVDTAPTGHTLRLLAMPALIHRWLDALDTLLAKHRYMVEAFRGSYQPDETDRFVMDLSAEVRQMQRLLTNSNRCCFIPVMLADEMSIRETMLLMDQLKDSRIPVAAIVINRLGPAAGCPVCINRRHSQDRLLHSFSDRLRGHRFWTLPLFTEEIRDQKPLQMFWKHAWPFEIPPEVTPADASAVADGPMTDPPGPFPLIREKFLLFAGKGGVGKTSLACATAIRMAGESGHREVFLFSTDPAHSLSDCLGLRVGPAPVRILPGLVAMEIDAQAQFDDFKSQYEDEIRRLMGSLSPNLDLTFDQQVMERVMDLSPPGLDEVMALSLAMNHLSADKNRLFILDSAPTGHLLRLLEMPEIIDQWLKTFFNLFLKYKHIFRLPGISKRMVILSKNLKRLRKLFQCHDQTAVLGVSILTQMAFEETRDLAAACTRMGLSMPTLFLNMAVARSTCAFCSALYQRETQIRQKFKDAFADKHQTLVFQQPDLRGIERLRQMGNALFLPRSHKKMAEG
jgi:arsenite/tail-anchored protein-transporting ATPase